MALGRMSRLHLLERPLRLLLVLHQVFEGVPHRVHARVRRVEGDEDELVPERAELAEEERTRIAAPLEGRRVVEGEWQVRMRLAHRPREGDRGLAPGVRELRPDEVDAG